MLSDWFTYILQDDTRSIQYQVTFYTGLHFLLHVGTLPQNK